MQDEIDDPSAHPSPPPEILIVLPRVPVSLQGSSTAKDAIREAVREQAETSGRFFIGEVEIQVEWLVHEGHRWDTPGVLKSPDIDNIVKPLIDGLCGPRGVLVDDCQVQSLMCSWIDWTDREQQQVTLRVRSLHPDDFIEARRLVGVERDDGLCWVLPFEQPAKVQELMLETLNRMRDSYETLVREGVAEEQARYVLPIARRFHRAHLTRHGFPVFATADYVERLRRQAADDQSTLG